jgi:UDP-glucose 4-epimerase
VPTTVNDIANAVIDEVERQTGTRVGIKHLPMRPGEPDNSIVLGNPETLRLVGVNPDELLSLEAGLVPTIKYFRQYLAGQK